MSNGFQHKLSQFEAMPPAKVWDAIAAELDGNATTGFAQKLYAFEATPSTNIWNKINEELEAESTPAKVIPFYKKHRQFIRYASMAAAIFAAVIMINLFSNKAESDNVAQLPMAQPVQHKNTQPVQQPENTSSSNNTVVLNDKPTVPEKKEAIALTRVQPNRYMTVANDDGKKVRLSKKVYPVINCAEKTEASTWSRCKENIQEMQAKMAASVGTSDFGGLIDMLKSLEEK